MASQRQVPEAGAYLLNNSNNKSLQQIFKNLSTTRRSTLEAIYKKKSISRSRCKVKEKQQYDQDNTQASLNSEEVQDRKVSIKSQLSSFLFSQYDKRIIDIAVPTLLALLTDPLLQLVDTIYTGQLGSKELAALTLNTGLFSFVFVLFNFLSSAVTPLISQSVSQNNKQECGSVVVQAYLIAVILGCLVTTFLLSFSDVAFDLMGGGTQSEDIDFHRYALQFLQLRALSAPPTLCLIVSQGIFRGIQDVQTPLRITVLANVINILLDPIFMFDVGGFGLHQGVGGAALSTTIAETIGCALFFQQIYMKRSMLGLDKKINISNNWKPFLQAGGALFLRSISVIWSRSATTAYAVRLGTQAAASHQILLQLWFIQSVMTDSLAVAGQTLVASEKKDLNQNKARNIADRLIQLGLVLAFAIVLVYYVAQQYIPRIFNAQPEVTTYFQDMFPYVIAMMPLNSVVYVLDGVLVGAGDYVYLAGTMLISSLICFTALTFFTDPSQGLFSVWADLSLLFLLRFLTVIYRYFQLDGPLKRLGQEEQQIIQEAKYQEEQNTITGKGVSKQVYDKGKNFDKYT